MFSKTYAVLLYNSGCFKGGSLAHFVFMGIHSDRLHKDLHQMLLLAATLG